MLEEWRTESSPGNFPSLPLGIATLEETLLQRFRRQYRTTIVDNPDQLRRAQRIRYQVYCIENRFENPDEHPDGLEQDEFDDHSAHCLLVCKRGGDVGTVRLVLPRPCHLDQSFALQRVVERKRLGASAPFPLNSTAEVSRFSLSKTFRRNGDEPCPRPEDGPLMRLGLIQALVEMSADNGITHWCALMEPKLLRMLAAMGIRFQPIGPLVEYHGLRQPCYCEVDVILENVRRERPAFWEVLTNGGALWRSLMAA